MNKIPIKYCINYTKTIFDLRVKILTLYKMMKMKQLNQKNIDMNVHNK